MAMSKVSRNAFGTDMSPLKLFSGYLLSDVMLDIRFSTTFGYSQNPDQLILTQYQALGLPKLVEEKKYPPYYESVLVVLEALAKSLDDEHFSFTHGLHTLFFPHLSSSKTNKLHYDSMQTMTLNLRLLDRLLGLFFVSQRLPLAPLSKDTSNQRDLTEFPKGATPYDQTGWMYDKFEEQDYHINSILDALQHKARQDDTSALSSTTPDKTSTGVKLEKLMAYHQRRSKAHAYDELAASMARAIWLHVEPEVGAADRLRQPIKMLQFISATSVLAPFFRIFLEAPVTFAIKDIKLEEAIQVLHRPDLNRSTSALLQIEEVLWSGVFDLIQQCCQQVTSPILHWDLGHTHHQEWEPANVLQGWCWAKRQMITHPDTAQHLQDHDGSSLPNTPSVVTMLPANPTSADESGIPNELPEPHMSGNQAESGSSELPPKQDTQGVAKASQLGGADEGANKNKPGTAAKLKKRTLPEEEIKAPPAKKQKKKKRLGKKVKKERQDTKAKRESSPPFKAAIPAKLTPKEEADYVKVNWTFSEDIEPMGELYEMPKVSQSFSTKLRIHRRQELASPEYVEFKHDIPKVPEQDHDFDFWQAVHDIAVSEQDTLPASCYPALHLTDEDTQSLSAEELGHFFKDHSLVIEPPASSTPMHHSHFEDRDGNITLEKVMDPDTTVEVHDLAGSSVEEGQQQATSRTSTVGKVFNHIKSQHGHVVNLLSITDASGLFPEPSSVLKLDSDRFAFSSTQTLKDTDKCTPKRSWLIVGGGGAVSRDHVDSAGKATYVKVEAGAGKLWLICLGRRDGADRITNSNPWLAERWAYTIVDNTSWVKDYHWQAIYLPKGSILIMRPYTIHIVLTPGPTLCLGGHFYSAPTMTATMHAKRYEHVHPLGLSNETHVGSWVGIHCMLIYAWWKVQACKSSPPYTTDCLAALVLMCQQPQYFTNMKETFPPDIVGYETQEKKAQVASSELRKSLPELDAAVVVLEERLKEWVGKLYTWWDGKAESYMIDVFEDSDGDEELEPESEDD